MESLVEQLAGRHLGILACIMTLIQSVAQGAEFVTCPQEFVCECVEQESHSGSHSLTIELDCSGKNLSHIPDWSPFHNKPVTKIDLSHNNIHSVSDAAFTRITFVPGIRGKWIPRLDIDDNPITSVSAGAFRGMKAAELLVHMKNTHITSFPSEAFRSIHNLTDLFFMHSKITDLPNGAFEGMNRLRRLDLSGNKLGKIKPDVFKGLNEILKTLHLDNMNLAQFPTKALRNLHALFQLKLMRNKIHSLHDNLFKDWKADSQQFELSLQHNDLTDIKSNAFRSSRLRLIKTNMEFNNISNVRWLKKPCSLIFTVMSNIRLSHNPMICSCNLYSVLRAGFYDLHGVCIKPEIFVNLPWISKDYDVLAQRNCIGTGALKWDFQCLTAQAQSQKSHCMYTRGSVMLAVVAMILWWNMS